MPCADRVDVSRPRRCCGAPGPVSARRQRSGDDAVEHLIVVVGENLTLDHSLRHLPPTGRTKRRHRWPRVSSRRIGGPGPEAALAAQHLAAPRGRYEVTPPLAGSFSALPQPGATYCPRPAEGRRRSSAFRRRCRTRRSRSRAMPSTMAFVGDPVHRFFQMWQQFDGGRQDLFVWVDLTSGEGLGQASRRSQPEHQPGASRWASTTCSRRRALSARAGPALHARRRLPSAVMGGTGANYFALATGYVASYLTDEPADAPAAPIRSRIRTAPRHAELVHPLRLHQRLLHRLCRSGAGLGSRRIRDYLATLPYKPLRRWQLPPGHYSSSTTADPGYAPDGTPKPLGPNEFTLPRSGRGPSPSALGQEHVVEMVQRRAHRGRIDAAVLRHLRCPHAFDRVIDRPPQAQPRRPGGARPRRRRGTLPRSPSSYRPTPIPAVPPIRPCPLIRAPCAGLIGEVQADPALSAETAILVTTDEAAAPRQRLFRILDFFGDGTRIAMIATRPLLRKGLVEHTLRPRLDPEVRRAQFAAEAAAPQSRDNLPKSSDAASDPYVPQNARHRRPDGAVPVLSAVLVRSGRPAGQPLTRRDGRRRMVAARAFCTETRKLETRARIIAAIRGFFAERGFAEVDTPALQVEPGLEPHLRPFHDTARARRGAAPALPADLAGIRHEEAAGGRHAAAFSARALLPRCRALAHPSPRIHHARMVSRQRQLPRSHGRLRGAARRSARRRPAPRSSAWQGRAPIPARAGASQRRRGVPRFCGIDLLGHRARSRGAGLALLADAARPLAIAAIPATVGGSASSACSSSASSRISASECPPILYDYPVSMAALSRVSRAMRGSPSVSSFMPAGSSWPTPSAS